jgi:hypothetical protein
MGNGTPDHWWPQLKEQHPKTTASTQLCASMGHQLAGIRVFLFSNTLSLCEGTEDQIQDLEFAWQMYYLLSYSPSPVVFVRFSR